MPLSLSQSLMKDGSNGLGNKEEQMKQPEVRLEGVKVSCQMSNKLREHGSGMSELRTRSREWVQAYGTSVLGIMCKEVKHVYLSMLLLLAMCTVHKLKVQVVWMEYCSLYRKYPFYLVATPSIILQYKTSSRHSKHD